MGGRHLPQGYVETGRWSLKQATPADILLAIVVGLSVPIALLILGSLLGGPDDSDVTIGGGTLIIGIVPGGRDGSRTARVGPRRLLPRVRRPPALRVQAVDALGACLLRGRAWKLLHQAQVRSLGPCAGSAADGVVGRRLSACGPKRRARLRRRMGPPVKRHGIGGRHAHDAQAGPLSPRDQFRGHRGRIRRLRTGERVRIAIGGLRLRHII